MDIILGEQTQLQQFQEELMQEPVEAPEELPIGEAGGAEERKQRRNPKSLSFTQSP